MSEANAPHSDDGILDLKQPSVPPGTLVYAIGDVHGCAALLEDVQASIVADANIARCERKVLVYLGDYVDRGPASREVVDLIVKKPLEGFERHFLKGNHEEFLLDFLADIEAGPAWLFNGGLATLASYGVDVGRRPDYSMSTMRDLQGRFLDALPPEHLAFYQDLEYSHTEGDFFFVHAGVRPGVPLDQQTSDDMLWIRDEFLSSDANHGKIIVHGHTITWEPEQRPNRIGIDTGAFHSGMLTCLVLEGEELDFVVAEGDAA